MMTPPPPPTARDAAALQRLWADRTLSDRDIDRALDELAALAGQRDRARELLRRLAEAWPRDVLREVEAWLAEDEPPRHRIPPVSRRR